MAVFGAEYSAGHLGGGHFCSGSWGTQRDRRV